MRGPGKPTLLAIVATLVPVLAIFGVIELDPANVEPTLVLSLVAMGAVMLVLFGGVFRLSRALP